LNVTFMRNDRGARGGMRDVVVVGAGHNALVAACYLARDGLDVEVVERDSVLGGAVSTVQRFPGYRVDRGSSLHVLIRHTGIAEELRLHECGLTYLDVDPWAYAPATQHEPALTFSTDLDRTCACIAAACGQRDADAYRRFVTDWTDPAQRILAAFQDPPSPLRVARRMAGLARGQSGAETTRRFLQPADHLLDTYFGSERLKAALAWIAAQSGRPPHEPATAGHLSWIPLLHLLPPGRPVGGSGMLAEALAERLRRYGGRVRLGDGAVRITRGSARVDGVVTASGEHIRARAVLAGCHVLTTFELLGEPAPVAHARARIRVGDGIGMAVRLGTTALPAYPAANPEAYHGMQLLVTDRRQLRTAYGDFLAGRVPAEPAVLAMTFSALDPTLAPAGRHGVSLWSQWHRYDLTGGASWDAVRDQAAQLVIDQVDRFAPGFAGTIEHTHVQTPLDLERELGLRRGNVMHVEMGLDAMFALRPLPGLASYRGPVEGLYLTGASTHPGGGVFGASGRSAARALLADRSSRLPRRSAATVWMWRRPRNQRR
jgi:phytoene dehydrogenase-like protein